MNSLPPWKQHYEDELRRILEIPPLDNDAEGAKRIVRCLFKPALRVECWISIVERDSTAEMTIRAPITSVWSYIRAAQLPANESPPVWTDRGPQFLGAVEPNVSIERIDMGETATTWRAVMDDVDRRPFGADSDPNAVVLDGITIDVITWQPDAQRQFSTRGGSQLDRADARYTLLSALIETASQLAKWRQSQVGLEGARI